MKSILLTIVCIAFMASISKAQKPAEKPVEKAKVETAKTADKAKMEMTKPTSKMKMANPSSGVIDSAKMKMAKSSTKMKMAKSSTTNGLDSATSTMKTKMGTHKMMKAKSGNSEAMANPKMHFKCPKGDALSDTGGKCPVCGTEMEAMDHPKMMKKSSKKMDGMEMKKEMKKEEKPLEKKG